VIIVDLDAQHGIDATLGLDPVDYKNSFVYHLEQWTNGENPSKYSYFQPIDSKTKAHLEGVQVAQGNISMGALSFDIQASQDREHKEKLFGNCLLSVAKDADFVLVDLPGSMMSFSLSEAVLKVTDYILIPEIPESRSLDVLSDLFDWLNMCQLTQKVLGIIPNRVTSLKSHTTILNAFKDYAKQLNITVFPTIRESGYIINAAIEGRVIAKQRPSSPVRSAIKDIASSINDKKLG
jgi:cellulose biosynthesis protein BcsQ